MHNYSFAPVGQLTKLDECKTTVEDDVQSPYSSVKEKKARSSGTQRKPPLSTDLTQSVLPPSRKSATIEAFDGRQVSGYITVATVNEISVCHDRRNGGALSRRVMSTPEGGYVQTSRWRTNAKANKCNKRAHKVSLYPSVENGNSEPKSFSKLLHAQTTELWKVLRSGGLLPLPEFLQNVLAQGEGAEGLSPQSD